ncbi:MAG: sugar transferase [Chloroflexota bacterium]|nr:sugar transferase [Chloroflexota bacterium]
MQADRLVEVLRTRIRLTDEVGCSSDGRIGVFLPDTPAEGAHKLARDISDILAADTPPPICAIYSYPSDAPPDHGLSAQPAVSVAFPRDEASPARRVADARLSTSSAPPYGCVLPRWKRVMDLAGALVGIVVLAPVMLGIALAIKLTSPGPVIFRQQRIGYRGRPFPIYKFRSMAAGASEDLHIEYVRKVIQGKAERHREGALKLTDDPRVTRVGKFLRKWSLDELPQLYNVLKGEMSLVGPRPDPIYASLEYRPWYHRRTLHVKPGISGLWQVEGRSRVTFEEMIRLDLRYSNSLSFATDVRIILRTFRAVFSRAGAY